MPVLAPQHCEHFIECSAYVAVVFWNNVHHVNILDAVLLQYAIYHGIIAV